MKVQCTKYAEKLRAATGKISLETKMMKPAEISARQIEKKILLIMRVCEKKKKEGWIAKCAALCLFLWDKAWVSVPTGLFQSHKLTRS